MHWLESVNFASTISHERELRSVHRPLFMCTHCGSARDRFDITLYLMEYSFTRGKDEISFHMIKTQEWNQIIALQTTEPMFSFLSHDIVIFVSYSSTRMSHHWKRLLLSPTSSFQALDVYNIYFLISDKQLMNRESLKSIVNMASTCIYILLTSSWNREQHCSHT